MPTEHQETLGGHLSYLKGFKNKDLPRVMRKVARHTREHPHEVLPEVCDSSHKEFMSKVMARMVTALIADQAQGNKHVPNAQKELKQQAVNLDQKQTCDDQAWGVVLEYLDRQMMEPGHTGTPAPVRHSLRDLFGAYAVTKLTWRP